MVRSYGVFCQFFLSSMQQWIAENRTKLKLWLFFSLHSINVNMVSVHCQVHSLSSKWLPTFVINRPLLWRNCSTMKSYPSLKRVIRYPLMKWNATIIERSSSQRTKAHCTVLQLRRTGNNISRGIFIQQGLFQVFAQGDIKYRES